MNENLYDTLKTIKNYVDNILDDETFSYVLTIFLVLYGNLAAPILPKKIAELFNTFNLKMLILCMIAYYSSKDPKISILMAICFYISIQTATNYTYNDNIKCIIINNKNKNNIEELKLQNLEDENNNENNNEKNIDKLISLEKYKEDENNMIYQPVEGFDENTYYNI